MNEKEEKSPLAHAHALFLSLSLVPAEAQVQLADAARSIPWSTQTWNQTVQYEALPVISDHQPDI